MGAARRTHLGRASRSRAGTWPGCRARSPRPARGCRRSRCATSATPWPGRQGSGPADARPRRRAGRCPTRRRRVRWRRRRWRWATTATTARRARRRCWRRAPRGWCGGVCPAGHTGSSRRRSGRRGRGRGAGWAGPPGRTARPRQRLPDRSWGAWSCGPPMWTVTGSGGVDEGAQAGQQRGQTLAGGGLLGGQGDAEPDLAVLAAVDGADAGQDVGAGAGDGEADRLGAVLAEAAAVVAGAPGGVRVAGRCHWVASTAGSSGWPGVVQVVAQRVQVHTSRRERGPLVWPIHTAAAGPWQGRVCAGWGAVRRPVTGGCPFQIRNAITDFKNLVVAWVIGCRRGTRLRSRSRCAGRCGRGGRCRGSGGTRGGRVGAGWGWGWGAGRGRGSVGRGRAAPPRTAARTTLRNRR